MLKSFSVSIHVRIYKQSLPLSALTVEWIAICMNTQTDQLA